MPQSPPYHVEYVVSLKAAFKPNLRNPNLLLQCLTGKGLVQFVMEEADPIGKRSIKELSEDTVFLSKVPPLLVLSSDQGGGGFNRVT